MNIVFLGSSHFAVPALKALAGSGHEVSCVVTQPDRLKGRGLLLGHTAVKETAARLGLKVIQPRSINSPEAIKILKGLKPDLLVVISYGQILAQEVLGIPKIMGINAHASLLPKYRGAAPINRALINGEKTTGVTIMKLVRQMDAGPIILQKPLAILDRDTALTLEEKLSHLAADSLTEALAMIEAGGYKLLPQDASAATLAPKLKKSDGRIDWNKPASQINNLIRGCLGWPGAFTHFKGKFLKIYKARVEEVSKCQSVKVSGQIVGVSHTGISVACAEGILLIEQLQPEAKRVMSAAEFAAGHRISVGETLS